MTGYWLGYALVAITPLVAGGCGAPQGGTGDVTIRDSAGVMIVDNRAPEWTEGDGWVVDSVPEVVLGAAGPNGVRDLLYVRDIVRMTSGDLVVANAGLSGLELFDSTGRFLRTIGREGRGPGEFNWMLRMVRCAGDTVMINQGYYVSVFDPRGAFVDDRQPSTPPGSNANQVLGSTADCRAVLMVADVRQSPPPPGTTYQPPVLLFWAGLGPGVWDTVAVTPGAQLFSLAALGSVFGIAVPFGSSSIWTTDGDHVFVGVTDRPEIQIHDRDRVLGKVVRWRAEARPLSPADRQAYDAWREDFLERNPEEPADLIPRSADLPWPAVRPLFAELLVDDEGNVWVRSFPDAPSGRARLHVPGPESPAESWWVIDSTGRWLGSVTMPRGLQVKGIQVRRILGVLRDTDGVEQVHVHRVIGNGEEG